MEESHGPKSLECMNSLETLYEFDPTPGLPLPSELAAMYGTLRFASSPDRPHVISNFVSTLDGVVSLDAQGKAVGEVISGSNQQDSMVMGLLRAAADTVVVGAGTLRASPHGRLPPVDTEPTVDGPRVSVIARAG